MTEGRFLCHEILTTSFILQTEGRFLCHEILTTSFILQTKEPSLCLHETTEKSLF